MPNAEDILVQAHDFTQELLSWQASLPELAWGELEASTRRGKVAVFCVDMINGFCHEGALASPRIQGIIPQVARVFTDAHAYGVEQFVLAQDCHSPESIEFGSFPPHCLQGTREAETIPELASLAFANLFTIIEKNSLSALHNTNLGEWLDAHSDLEVAIVVGDCTDLCVQQMALHLKLSANASNRPLRVIVPENAVQTYDTPIPVARELGILPHSADILHLIFLYQMRLNGVEIVKSLA